MDLEKQKLIQAKDKKDTRSSSAIQKYVIVCTALCVFLLGGLTLTTIQNEWVQHKIQTDKLPDLDTKQNISSCGETNKSDPVYKNHTIVQQEAAHWSMYFNYAVNIPMLFMNMILNTYTDSYGRRFLLILSVFGVCLKYSVVCVVIHFNLSLWYIFGAYIIDGASGSSYGTLAALFAYTADISKEQHNRVLGIVGIESVMMITAVVSNMASGFLVETLDLGFSNTALICTSSALIGLLIFIFLVPESLDKSKRTPPKPIIGTVKQMFKFYFSLEYKGKRLGYILLITSFCTGIICLGTRTALETLYFLALPFCWDLAHIGIFLSVRHAAQGVIAILLLRPLQLFLSNEVIAILGTISCVGSYVIEGLATTDIMIYMVPVAGLLASIMLPLVRSLMSVITEPDKQGALFSSIATMEVLSIMASSTISNEIYAVSYSFMHGFVFLFLGGIGVIDFVLLLAYYIQKYAKKDNPKNINSYQKVDNQNLQG